MKKILVVEDDKFLRDLIIGKLKEEGFEVIFAIDGADGLKQAREAKPDLVLLDLILPTLNGFEVLKQMKEDSSQEIKSIPVVILSNLGQQEDVKKGLDLGAVDFLIKANYTLSEIVEKAKEVLAGEN